MSKAGIQSNRGDGYQTLVAFDWALTVMSDPEFQWIEIDSVNFLVDDIVISKVDGTKICCQCKKNQSAYKPWTVTDLADELSKAGSLLVSDPKTVVRFYSRSAFGELAALQEYSTSYADETTYQANLGKSHRETDKKLNDLLKDQAIGLSSYEFISRTEYINSNTLDRMQTLLLERLRQLVSSPTAAYAAIWKNLDYLGMRATGSPQSSTTLHRLTKANLKEIIEKAGSMLVPPLDASKIHRSFQNTSAIGRVWRRRIGKERIPNKVTNDLLSAIVAKNKSILLTGLPGSGKTCVMLDLQEKLEQLAKQRSDLLPLFIQSREFADMDTAQERQAQGLSESWVEEVARTAEDIQVVVVLDSLDVLSIAREHFVLTYFLAQIDRLLLIPNVTVVTACRDFDRRYDQRIAQRTWDKEFSCQPLDWNSEILPLLEKNGIDTSIPDVATRELIRNPRELALYVELAEQGGSFNVVTSQALAMRYLHAITQTNNTLGDSAMLAVEAIADEMLRTRSLAVHRQRFSAPQNIQRALLSQNVLHETHDGRLTFGHQTLLDVLVVSGAIRRGLTLNEFIRDLPPVPFVRPSIRSFISQLATGERRHFRKQLRTVLSGDYPFHIRRLVAESFAEQLPNDDEWLLIKHLKDQHRDVFQVIYTQAVRVEWHYYWLKHLVPVLRDARDADGFTAHVHRVSRWKNEDIEGVLALWTEALDLDWIDRNQITEHFDMSLADLDRHDSTSLASFLLVLLKLPRRKHSMLGRALARCVQAGTLNDEVLWTHIVGDIIDDDICGHRFSKKLRCQPSEFGCGEVFLIQRMQKSTMLLDLAIASVERWHKVKNPDFNGTVKNYWRGFLHETSHTDAHSKSDHRHVDEKRFLFDAIEAAIVSHAANHSDWWQTNRERLRSSHEGSLQYFAIIACTATPITNVDLIVSILRDKPLLESELAYELGTLISTSFIYLETSIQYSLQSFFLTLHSDDENHTRLQEWAVKKQAQLIIAIPCHLRSIRAQLLLDDCEKIIWPLVRHAKIGMEGGLVSAPFSFEVFLAASDNAVLRLLAHYDGHVRTSSDDFLIGGQQEVGCQLREAASRNPTRFLRLLHMHWAGIADTFCDEIMNGVATYLAYRHGNLQSNGTWSPIEEPDAGELAKGVLDELERHPHHWSRNHSASNALQSSAHVIPNVQEAARLVFLALNFITLREEATTSGEDIDLLTIGINMKRGYVVDALMIVVNQLQRLNAELPELIIPALRQFASDENPAIRAVLLRRLPSLQSSQPNFGWELFSLVMQNGTAGLWVVAEPCLYYSYHQEFEIIAPWLAHLGRNGYGKDLKTWGRISALAAFSNKISFPEFLTALLSKNDVDAWNGAASVWTHPGNMQQHRAQCLEGLREGLDAETQCALAVARKFGEIFRNTTPLISIPTITIQRFFDFLMEEENSEMRGFFGFEAWLNATARRDPLSALAASEIYLKFFKQKSSYLYDYEDDLTQLLTCLFAQAEEQEEADDGIMLQRVVAMQDTLLSLGVNEVNEWLKAAERT